MSLLNWFRRRQRGSNAIEFFFALAPVTFITMAYAQFYFLAQGAYFGLTKGYGEAFSDVVNADWTDSCDENMGESDFEADIYIFPRFRGFIGQGAYWNWDPPGDNHLEDKYIITGGCKGDWWDFVTPGLGFVGIVEQYIDFPWSSFNFSSVTGPPPPVGSQSMYGDIAGNAIDDAGEAADNANTDTCSALQEQIDTFNAFKAKAAACKDPNIYTQLKTGGGDALYYDEDDIGGSLYAYPLPDDVDPDDLVPAYPSQYYVCSDDDYTENFDNGDNYGYGSAAQAQTDYDNAQNGINQTMQTFNESGC
ncbi:MAG: hypothetical protein ABI743_15145 [bacterium]